MNVHVHTADLIITFACDKPKGEPRGLFARFLHEAGIDGCTLVLGAQERVPGVMPSVPGRYFSEGGKG